MRTIARVIYRYLFMKMRKMSQRFTVWLSSIGEGTKLPINNRIYLLSILLIHSGPRGMTFAEHLSLLTKRWDNSFIRISLLKILMKKMKMNVKLWINMQTSFLSTPEKTWTTQLHLPTFDIVTQLVQITLLICIFKSSYILKLLRRPYVFRRLLL